MIIMIQLANIVLWCESHLDVLVSPTKTECLFNRKIIRVSLQSSRLKNKQIKETIWGGCVKIGTEAERTLLQNPGKGKGERGVETGQSDEPRKKSKEKKIRKKVKGMAMVKEILRSRNILLVVLIPLLLLPLPLSYPCSVSTFSFFTKPLSTVGALAGQTYSGQKERQGSKKKTISLRNIKDSDLKEWKLLGSHHNNNQGYYEQCH